ncbi:MAG TPA: 2-hydroxyacyl-CoA dehydratase family protein [Planctomycetota bacterium]|nr:2-hydroxyacyl-CoA dehydratase family protein [Planctomycetota bacterium]HRR80902.1 2-hydroxyacyl-CoA dehydratase family protein [Planctomycetota bacterium]HRT93525.1 2-hydroxyacyl-CoA dehydratase family protein [Planctomycetota bacterium]
MSAPERKDFQTTGKMREVMGRYFAELGRGPQDGRKTAWCTSVGPAELLRALGFNVYFPENHGAMLGASRMATDLIPLANARGFSPDICSYLTSDIGSYLKGETPLQKMGLKGLPKADVLVFNTNQCRDVKDWFQFYAREWNVPCLGIHTPRAIGEVTDTIVDDVARQHEALVAPLEAIAGARLDPARLSQAIALSKQCTDLWRQVLETAAHVPSPISFFDDTIQMGPAVVLRGHPDAVAYYQALLAELNERIAAGVAAVPGEKFRIYWDGMPVWGRLRNLSQQFTDLRACVVASTYCNSWIFDALDPAAPFRSMARAYSSIFICRSEDEKEKYIEAMAAKFKVNGILYHDSKTCPNNSNNRYQMPQRLQAKLGKPFLVIHGDLNDLRLYSEEQTRTNIEAFVEQLAEA